MSQEPGWTLIETLEGRATVVARDHVPRRRTSLARAVQDRVGGKAAVRVTPWLEDLLAEQHGHTAAGTFTCALGDGTEVAAHLVPIPGPDGTLFGAHVWLGRVGDTPEELPRLAFGLTWDTQARIAEIPRALAAGAPRAHLTAPEVFRFFDPEDSLGLIRTLLTPAPGACWQGAVTVSGPEGRTPAHALLVAGSTADTAERWKGLLFESPDQMPRESLEAVALQAIQHLSGVHMALLDVAKMRLIRWITDPLSEVLWKGQVDQRDAPHPDDVKRIFEAVEGIFTGRADSATVDHVRLRRRGGGWVVVNGAGTILRTSPDSPQLGIVEFRVIGYSDDPDSVPPTDQGHPGLDDPDYPNYPLK